MPEEDLHSLLDSIISIPISDWVLFENIADTQVLAPKPKQYFLFYITKLNSNTSSHTKHWLKLENFDLNLTFNANLVFPWTHFGC